MDSCVNYARKAITQALKTYVTTLENGKKIPTIVIDGWLNAQIYLFLCTNGAIANTTAIRSAPKL